MLVGSGNVVRTMEKIPYTTTDYLWRPQFSLELPWHHLLFATKSKLSSTNQMECEITITYQILPLLNVCKNDDFVTKSGILPWYLY